MLVAAQKKYQKLVQMGTQQRSSPHTIEIVDKITTGLIGRAYYAKAWYSNTRKSIGTGKEAPVPPQLDWDLWQGPAPRRPTRTTSTPTTGTGSASGAPAKRSTTARTRSTSAAGPSASTIPSSVTASGGRYQFKDDWQFYDTLVTSFEYDDKMISWEGKCCQGMKFYDATAAPPSWAPPAQSSSIAAATRSTTSKARRPASSKSAAAPPRPPAT